MTWDLVFLLKNYPKDYRFQAPHFMVVEVSVKSVAAIVRATKNNPEAKAFFVNTEQMPMTALVFRVDATTESDALELGKHQLEGVIDGLSILLERNLPKVCPVVQLRRRDEADSTLVEIRGDDWAYFSPKENASNVSWQSYQRSLLTSLMPFFDIASSLHPKRDSSLSRQLLYSMKMYRHGTTMGIFGLEYLCKWSALEGLVCGGEQGKKNLLLGRLPSLFPKRRAEFVDTVSKLWVLRNEAIHEARAFDSDHLHEAPLLGPQIESVEFLFLNVVVFALSQIQDAESVSLLWERVASYQPRVLIRERPADMPRVAVKKFMMKTDMVIKNGGLLIDRAFASRQASRTAPKLP